MTWVLNKEILTRKEIMEIIRKEKGMRITRNMELVCSVMGEPTEVFIESNRQIYYTEVAIFYIYFL